MGLVTTW